MQHISSRPTEAVKSHLPPTQGNRVTLRLMGVSVNTERFRKKEDLSSLQFACMGQARVSLPVGTTVCRQAQHVFDTRRRQTDLCHKRRKPSKQNKIKTLQVKPQEKKKIIRIIFIHSEGSPLTEQNHRTEISQTELKGVFRLLVHQFSIHCSLVR